MQTGSGSAEGQSVGIILIEDDDGHATLIKRNLRRAGLMNDIRRLADGQEALDYFFGDDAPFVRDPRPASVILLDLKMPRIDGLEVLRRLKAGKQTSSLPVIVLTTTDDPREIERCYELGCNVYVTKPVESDAFIEAVRRLGFFLQVVKLPTGGR
jgi:CheY-like chemotaxis protein